MTGKEALEYIANLLFMFTSAGRKSGKDYTLKALCKIEDELDGLTKYKKAFEILKNKFFIDLIERQEDGKLGFEPINPIENQPRFAQLTKEEYELLEELMEDAKD